MEIDNDKVWVTMGILTQHDVKRRTVQPLFDMGNFQMRMRPKATLS